MALQPLHHLSRNTLMDDIERGQHIDAQPSHERFKESIGFVLVDLPCGSTGRGGHLTSASVKAQFVLELLVHVGQFEENFISELLIIEVRRFERLEKVKIKIPWWLSCRTLIRCSEKQVSPACDLVLSPFNFMLPNLVSPNVGREIGQFQYTG